jgi:outer membrane protein OmpA-like peptidoglycan-associated protein
MEKLPEPRRRPLRDEDPPRRRTALWVVLALLAAGLIGLLYYWNRTTQLQQYLAAALEQTRQLKGRIEESSDLADETQKETEELRRRAAESNESAERSDIARQQDELATDFARREAEQQRLESERALSEAAEKRAELERIRKARQEELDRMQQALARIAPTRRTPEGMVMSLGDDQLLFEFGKANLGAKNREMLSRIAGVLLVSRGFRLYVYGHTDHVGAEDFHQQLSERRALAVRGYLVEAGVASDIIDAQGFGESSPAVKGTSPDARRQNRRVEIGVVDTIVNYQGEVPDVPEK